MTRVALRSLRPGQRVRRIEERRFVGPRGGKYVFRGMSWRNGTQAVVFTGYRLDGSDRVFEFEGAHPLRINDALSAKLVAQVEDSESSERNPS